MNRRRLVWMLVVALCLVAAGLALWLPRYAAAQRVSDLYRRYEHNPHLTVAYLEDFSVNDTVAVDVVTITAIDAAGWDTLKGNFNIVDYPPELLPFIDTMAIEYFYAAKDDYSRGMDSVRLNNDFVAVSRFKKEVTVFEIKEEKQIMSILSYNIKKQKENEN